MGSSASSSVGIAHDRARDRDALLLAARELAREVGEAVAEPHQLERRLRARSLRSLPLILTQQQRQLDVLERGQHRNQVVELEDVADVARRASFASARPLSVRDVGLADHRRRPTVGWSMPPIRLSSVVLPLPDGPISATKSPSSMSSERPSSTGTSCVSRGTPCARRALRPSAIELPSVSRRTGAAYARGLPSSARPGGSSTTVSPPTSPAADLDLVAARAPELDRCAPRRLAVPPPTRARRPPSRTTAARRHHHAPRRGRDRRGLRRSRRNTTLAPISGRMRGSRSRIATFTCTVAFWRSAVGTTWRTRPRERGVGVGVERDARRLAVARSARCRPRSRPPRPRACRGRPSSRSRCA